MSSKKTTRKYKAFISYKHSDIGRKHAVALETGLKRYAKPILTRPIKIFRDEKHMVPGNDLSKLITDGLDESEYLIFIAEKGAADSKWCCDELEYWCGTLGRIDQLIILHVSDSIHLDTINNKVDWEKSEALPTLLGKYISSIPLYVDVHQLQKPNELTLEHSQYKAIINLVSAKLRGVAPEELNDEELRVHRRNIRLRNLTIGVLSFLLFFAFQKRNEALASAQEARDNAKVAEQKTRAAQNTSLVFQTAKNNPTLAVQIANYNIKKHPENPAVTTAFQEIINDRKNHFFQQEFLGHTSEVSSVAFSPDGKTILTGSFDHTAKLWDLSGNELQTFTGHSSEVTAVAFSPDGKTILTGSRDSTAKLWYLSGNVSITFKGHKNYVTSVAFSPDGKKILTGSRDKTAKLWDLSGKELQTFTKDKYSVSAVAFSPSGDTILTVSNTVILWDLSGKELKSFSNFIISVTSVAFSPHGTTILTGSRDKTAKLWDIPDKYERAGPALKTFAHTSSVTSVAFSPDGTTILTGNEDNTLKIWDLSGQELQTFMGHSSSISAVAFSPDGKTILTGSRDTTAKLWNFSGKELRTLKPTFEFSRIAFSPDGDTILMGSVNMVELWDLSGKKLKTIKVREKKVKQNFVAFSPDRKKFLTVVDWNKTMELWDLSGTKLQTFKGVSQVTSVAFSPDGKTILTGSKKITQLWNLSSDEKLKTFFGHLDEFFAVAFSPDGDTILTGNWDAVKLWNLSGQELKSFKAHEDVVFAAAFSPDGKMILTASGDKTAKLWDLSGKELQTFKGHSEPVYSVAFSPDGKTILTASGDKTAKLWDLSSGKELQTFVGHTEAVVSAAFSPDGKTILTGSVDNTTKLWRLPQPFLDQKVHQYSLQELYDAGMILEEEDLKKVEQKEEK